MANEFNEDLMPFLYADADNPCCTLIFAHGAGAPMDSDFMEAITRHLVALDINVVRFEFAYMAQRRLDAVRRPPNKMALLQDAWREVYRQLRAQSTQPIIIAGKSMGGRVASMLADELQPLALVCLGYPFYPIKKMDRPRTEHLLNLRTPTLIVQGERDALGCRDVVESYSLSPAIEIEWMALADHDLKPLKRSGCTQEQYLQRAAHRIKDFIVRHMD